MVNETLEYGCSYYLGADISKAEVILEWLKKISREFRTEVPCKIVPQISVPDVIPANAWANMEDLECTLSSSPDKFVWTVNRLHINEENSLVYNSAFVHPAVLVPILRLFYKSCDVNRPEDKDGDGKVVWKFEFLDNDFDSLELDISLD